MSIGARFSQQFGLARLGIHHERLLPGRCTSYPHAESAEEEFVYVIAGTPDVWLDGELHRLRPGDAVGFPSGTGICHSFLNNSGEKCISLWSGKRASPRIASSIRAIQSRPRARTGGVMRPRELAAITMA